MYRTVVDAYEDSRKSWVHLALHCACMRLLTLLQLSRCKIYYCKSLSH
jgi:hypothetical protein